MKFVKSENQKNLWVRKIARKSRKPGFHVFCVFTSFLGVSDSLVYPKRRGLERSIAWYKKFLISCLVARYSAVFVFKSIEIHGNPCRITRSTLQNQICYRMSVSRAPGTPCGSVFGRFCVSLMPLVWPGGMRVALESTGIDKSI